MADDQPARQYRFTDQEIELILMAMRYCEYHAPSDDQDIDDMLDLECRIEAAQIRKQADANRRRNRNAGE